MLKKLMYAPEHTRVASLHAARARQWDGEGKGPGKALITRNGRIFISERGTESSRRAQKNKTIDKKNYEMREGTLEIIGGEEEPRILLPSAPRGAPGVRRALLRNGVTGGGGDP